MCPAVNNKYKREYSESARKKRGIKDIDKIMRRYKYYLEKIKLKSSLHRCIHMNSRKFSINVSSLIVTSLEKKKKNDNI